MSQTQTSVLIVDDQPDNLRSLKAILRTEGYKVRTAVSGEVALKTVCSQPPDIILLDIRMPNLDGYAVCSTLKAAAATSNIPIIFLSALGDTADKLKGFAAGGSDYITKPFQAQEVIARVENQLRIQRLSQQLTAQNALLQHEIRTRQQTEVILQQEIGDRQQVEAALKDRTVRLRKHNSVLMGLARNPAINQGDLPAALKAITQATAQNIAVERASVWLFDPTNSYLQCLDLFEQSPNQHSKGHKLTTEDYPNYFQALTQEQLIVADDALSDPRTREFLESYLTPLGITSMLDAPIHLGGKTVGALCGEHVGAARHFSPEDQNFVRSAADLVSLTLEARERQQAQQKLGQTHAELEQRAAELTAANTQLHLALAELKKSEANLVAAQRVAHVGNWEFDILTQKMTWSEELFRIFDLDPTQAAPTIVKILRLIHPDDRALWHQNVMLSLNVATTLGPSASGNSYEFDFRIMRKDGQIRYVEARGEAVLNDSFEVRKLFGTLRDITERQQREESLRLIVEGTASATGDQFMYSCVRYLAQVLQVRYAMIAQAVDESHTKFRTLAFWLGKTYSQNIEYNIADTPCEKVSSGRMYHCPQDVQVLFPNAQDLVKLNAQSYLGMPLINSNGNLMGYLAVLDVKPMALNLGKEMILKIFAARTAAELERQQAENRLRESENLYRQMFEVHNAIKLLINPESGAIIDANQAAQRFYGYELAQLKQMAITDLNEPPPEQVLAKMAQTASQQHGEFRFRHRLTSGEIRDVAVYSSSITRQGESLLYSIIHDITTRIQAEEGLRQSTAGERKKAQELKAALKQLKHTQAQLIQTEKMSSLGRMVAGVAHEINNPVSFICGNLTPAREYFQDLLKLIQLYQQTYPHPTPEIQELTGEIDLEFLLEDWSKLMNSMQVGTERIQEIIFSLKSFSRLDEAELKSVDIHEGIDNTLLILQHRLKAVGDSSPIEVIKDYGQLPPLTCYVSQLNQVFMNLLSNAIDALETQPEPRIITIRTAIESREWRIGKGKKSFSTNDSPRPTSVVVIRIADNGPGMSEEVIHQIFDPFFTTKSVGKGTGLGLSISHQIVVEKHSGQLSCNSAPGKGTEFIVAIPVASIPFESEQSNSSS